MQRISHWFADRPWLTLAALAAGVTGVLVPELARADAVRASPRPASGLEREAARQAASPTPAMSAELIHDLIRTTLLSLDDANRSGNYSVLRDLADPGFQANHTAADLAVIFADFRRKGLVLSSAALLTPQLSADPTLDKTNTLRLKGYLPTAPLRLVYDLKYRPLAGSWRLSGIAITTEAAKTTTTSAIDTSTASHGWTARTQTARHGTRPR